MPVDDALFGDPSDKEEPALVDPHAERVADWQVGQLRKALDAQGVTEMAARQRLVESAVGRAVASLRDLTPAEARRLADSLAETRRSKSPDNASSSWDTRDEETWIDRL